MPFETFPYKAGERIRVTQQISRQTGVLSTSVEGRIVRFEQSKTGSWYAHAKDDRLWLDRLILKKNDGEIVTLNLDQYSVVEPAGA